MNILPIPALDGGHVLFLLYEIVTGRKPSEKFLEYAQIVGMVQAVHHLVKVEKESTTGKYEVCAPHSLANVAARVAGGTK